MQDPAHPKVDTPILWGGTVINQIAARVRGEGEWRGVEGEGRGRCITTHFTSNREDAETTM